MPLKPSNLSRTPTNPNQDLTPVVFHNKKAPVSYRPTQKRIIQHKHIQGNPSAQRVAGMTKARKLDDSTASTKHPTVSKSFSKALMKARGGKNMTQLDLANATHQPLSVIKHYEAGKAIPNDQVINKLNRVLGVSLPSTKK